MQPLNDDMDNMFRRAAENYPLNISGADWSKVQKALHQQPATPPVEEKDNKRRYFLFFLIFPIALISLLGYKYFVNNSDNQQDTPATVQNVHLQTSAPVQSSRPATIPGILNNAVAKPRSTNVSKRQISNTSGSGTKLPGTNKVVKDQTQGLSSLLTTSANAISSIDPDNEPVDLKPISADPLLSMDGKLQGRSADPLFNSNGLNAASPSFPVSSNSLSRAKRFYVGVVGGIDGTTVKFQKITNMGSDYGIILGYQLNKKLSIETGLINEKKYYYSDGEYFSTKNISLPANSEITKVDGNCRMFEIPVVLKYNLSHFKNGQWFATTGFTSYFMRKEDYEYTYYYPTTNWSRDYYASYNTKRSSLVSNLQLSGGYTHSLGRVADLRVEPYIKIPLRGVGTGSLPLTSGGIRLAITRKLF
jgi:hypothetical protein